MWRDTVPKKPTPITKPQLAFMMWKVDHNVTFEEGVRWIDVRPADRIRYTRFASVAFRYLLSEPPVNKKKQRFWQRRKT
jgi:hypothetical protein